MMTVDDARRYQASAQMFSRDILCRELYPYQAWVQAILDTVNERRDELLVIEMPRQSGKNEGSAQAEVMILARHMGQGGQIVKTAPTAEPQISNSRLRFKELAEVAAARLGEVGVQLPVVARQGNRFQCGRAWLQFLSGDPKANVVGATASLLLEVDEAQDFSAEKFQKDFSPMRASTAAPLVAYGTTWTDDTLLEQFKWDVQEGRVPGRYIRVSPDEVAAANPAYGRHVEREVARLGRDHPLVRTQYYLEPLANRGRLLSVQQLRQMRSVHPRQSRRTNELQIVAGLDWAGADEDAGELASLHRGSKRDSVALTIGAVTWTKVIEGVWQPTIRILARHEWTNAHPLSLHTTLYKILHDDWKINRVHSDATGIGATGTLLLAKALDNETERIVKGRTFDSAWNTQTDLAFQYVEAINGSRLLDHAVDFDVLQVAQAETPPTAEPDRHAWWQRAHARLEARPSQRVRAYVPTSEGHDDLLLSEMLMVDAALAVTPVMGPIKSVQRPTI
jgi:hypothetical protein